MKLSEVRRETALRVLRVGPECAQRLRLMELGMIPGAAITARRGPGRGMIEVRVRGTRLTLGKAQADAVTVRR